MASTAAVKKTAKTALKGKYLRSIICGMTVICAEITAVIIFEITAGIIGMIPAFILLAALNIFIVLPLFMGAMYFFRRLVWGADDNVILTFEPFSSREKYKRTLGFVLLYIGKLIEYAVPLFLPSVASQILSSASFYDLIDTSMPVWASNLWVLTAFLRIIGAVVLFFAMLKFYLAPFIFVSNDEISVFEAMKISSVISKRTSSEFIFLIFSFVLYIIISLFLMPLPFVLPLFIAAYIVHSRFAVAQYNKAVDELNNSAPYFAAGI